MTETRAAASRLIAIAALAFFGCASDDDGSSSHTGDGATTVASDFESGSIGSVQQTGDTAWLLSLRDDNDNADLPDSWRTWWYVRLDHASTAEPTTITVNNNVWPNYYLPVYSYDQRVWSRFDEAEVTQPDAGSIRVVKRFTEPTVWLARFYPYTFADLNDYLGRAAASPRVQRETVGTTQRGRPLEVVTITDPAVDAAGKQRIWLHARSHPAETGSSFVLEGLIDFLASGDPDAETALSHFVFSILPMHNIDGVIAGNYRTTPASENLESLWLLDPADPSRLRAGAPREVQVLHDAMVATMAPLQAIPVSVALNLHSSNSEPDAAAFFFPHFGPMSLGYSDDQAALFTQQIAFTDAVEQFYGAGRIAPRPSNGGSSFLTGNFPETWWWVNRGPDVVAMTLETVYGRAGFAPRWVTPPDLRALGQALVRAMLAYHGLPVSEPAPPRAGAGLSAGRSATSGDRTRAGSRHRDW